MPSAKDCDDMDLLTPAWILQVAQTGNAGKLYYRKCLCGTPVVECRIPVWGSYDAKLIHGVEDLTVAVILRKPLDELRWNQTMRRAGVYTTMRYSKDKYYLQPHDCGYAPIGTVSDGFSFPEPTSTMREPWDMHITQTKQDVDEFKKAWYKEGKR